MLVLRRISQSLLCGVFFSIASIGMSAASEMPLRDEVLAQTPEGRSLLKYLVSCAMPEGTTVVAMVGGERFTFAGKMALAPAWSTRSMTEREERLVSACLLARTNRFGVPVEISSRNDTPGMPPSLQADARERERFAFFEGGFFGNMFKDDAEAYVCIGDRSRIRQQHLERLRRECALPMATADSARPLSRCSFIIAGDCGDKPFVQNGADYSKEVISVFLPAQQ